MKKFDEYEILVDGKKLARIKNGTVSGYTQNHMITIDDSAHVDEMLTSRAPRMTDSEQILKYGMVGDI